MHTRHNKGSRFTAVSQLVIKSETPHEEDACGEVES